MHHYISVMHELGHTTARHAPVSASVENNNADGAAPRRDGRGSNGSIGGADDRAQNRAESERGNNGPANTSGDPETTVSGSTTNNSNGNDNVEGGDGEGLGRAQPPLAETDMKAALKGSVEANGMRRMYSDGPRRSADEQHSGSLRDLSRHTNATDVSIPFDFDSTLSTGSQPALSVVFAPADSCTDRSSISGCSSKVAR